MRPLENIHKISRKDLDSLHFPSKTGGVMVRIPYRNRDEKTKGGIYVVADEDYKPAMHAERWGYIYKMSDSLLYDKTDVTTMQWKTEMEAKVGDKVWFDFRSALYAHTYECDGEWYKMMEYQNLYIAERGEEKIPLNGYVLFSEFKPDPDSDILLTTNIDKKYGVVEYVGSYNQEYAIPIYNDAISIERGDHVLFEQGTSCFPLESGLHNEFSKKKYVIQQRKRIVAVVDKDHKKVLRLHEGVIGVKVKKRNLTKGEIELLKDDKDHRIGKVVVSSHVNISEGDTVLLSKKAGTQFNGIEYLLEDKVLYYESVK